MIDPLVPDEACWHGNGGLFGDEACSSSKQCCEGSWEDQGSCGECACIQETGSEGCVPDAVGEQVCFLSFSASVGPVSSELQSQMNGVSYHEGCPVGFDELSLLEMSHWGFDGEIHQGQLIIGSHVVETVHDSFEHAYKWRFAIEKMEIVSVYGGNDDDSMAANNTSAFNCRTVSNSSSWSMHSYGTAIDINPVQNPYVVGSSVYPPAGKAYVERDPTVPGLIIDPGPLTGAFIRKGWGWGGNWTSLKDYQHFSENDQ